MFANIDRIEFKYYYSATHNKGDIYDLDLTKKSFLFLKVNSDF